MKKGHKNILQSICMVQCREMESKLGAHTVGKVVKHKFQ